MGSWDSYTQKVTPEDNDTLMIKDSAAGANKRTPFSGVWNWIVNKMTNAVISNLKTTNKMIIPAINELNSKSKISYSLRDSTNIPESADMNTYIEPGNYCCNGITPTTLKNSPFADAFLLKVEYPSGTQSYRSQTFILYNSRRIAYRFYTVSTQTWSDFIFYDSNEDVLSAYITSGVDYDNLTSGVHYCGTNCQHAPENYCRVICLYGIRGARLNDAIQVAIPVLSPAIYTRTYNTGKWSQWRKFTGTLVS